MAAQRAVGADMRRTLCIAFIVFALSYPAIAQQPTTAAVIAIGSA
jgi:hypothetical protein